MAFGFGHILAYLNSVWLNLYEQGDNAIIWYRVRILPHLHQTLSLGAPPPKPPTVTYYSSVSYEVTRTQIQMRTTTLTTGMTHIAVATVAPNPTAWPSPGPAPTLSVFGLEIPQVLTRNPQPFNFGFNGYSTNNPVHLLCLALAIYCLISVFLAITGWVWRKMWAACLPTLPTTPTKRPRYTIPPPNHSASRTPWYEAFGKMSQDFRIHTWNCWNFVLNIQYSPFRHWTVAATWFILDLLWFVGCAVVWLMAVPALYVCAFIMILIPLADAFKAWLEKHLRPRFGKEAMLFWWKASYQPMLEVAFGKKVERTAYEHGPQSKLRRIIVMYYIFIGTISRRDLRAPPLRPWNYYRFDPDALLGIPQDPEEIIKTLMSHGERHSKQVNELRCRWDQAILEKEATDREVERLKLSNKSLYRENCELDYNFKMAERKWHRIEKWHNKTAQVLKSNEEKISRSLKEQIEIANNCPKCKELNAQVVEIQTKMQENDSQMQKLSVLLEATQQQASKAEAELASSTQSKQELQVLQVKNAELQSSNEKLDTDNKTLRKSLHDEIAEKEVYLEETRRVKLELAEGCYYDIPNPAIAVQDDAGHMDGLMNHDDHEMQRWQLRQEEEYRLQQEQEEQWRLQQQQQLVSPNAQPVASPVVPGLFPPTPPQFQQGQGFGQQQQQNTWSVQMEHDQPQKPVDAPNPFFAVPKSPKRGPRMTPVIPQGTQYVPKALRQEAQQPSSAPSSSFPPTKMNGYSFVNEGPPLFNRTGNGNGNAFSQQTSSASSFMRPPTLNLPLDNGPSLFSSKGNGNDNAPSQPSKLRHMFSATGNSTFDLNNGNSNGNPPSQQPNSKADALKLPRRSLPIENLGSLLGGNGANSQQQQQESSFQSHNLNNVPANGQNLKLHPLKKSSFQPPPPGLKRNSVIGFK